MSDWPIVARATELRTASEALCEESAFQGVVLIGAAGVGKTTLARELARALQSTGHTARFVLGTQAGKAVPLGAFHRILQMTDAREPSAMLGAAHLALARLDRLVLVVDDAQHLDPISALLVQQLACSDGAKLVVTVRSGETVPDPVTAMWKERFLARLDISPFTRAQTEELLHAALDGEVDEQFVDRMHRLAAGSPLVLRSMVETALADGVLCRDGDRWRLRGTLRVGPELGDLVAARLDVLAEDELEAVEIVSTAEVLDLAVLRALCDPDTITRAERRGVIAVVADGSHVLAQPAHPILGEVVRQRCGVPRSRQLNTKLAQHLSALVRSGRSDVRTRIQLARFISRSDVPPDLDAITDAAASAITMSNLSLGEELARFAVDHGAGVPALILLADAVSWQGRGEEAEAVLAAVPPDGTDDLTIVRWGCLRAANLFFGCGRTEAARAALATVRDRVESESMLRLVTAMEVSFAYFAADLTTAIALGSEALATEMIPMATVWTSMATAGALALSGRFAQVGDAAEIGVRAAEGCESGPQRYSIALAEVLAFTASGELAAAHEVCDRYSAMTAGVPQAEAIVAALTGRVELARGRTDAACDALTRSLWTMSQSLPPGWVMLVAAWLTQAEGARANVGGAMAALARAEDANGPQVAVFLPELELARGWCRAAMGETTAARQHAVRAAQTARTGGMNASEMAALHTAVRFGDRTQRARLRELGTTLDTPMAAAIVAHSRGLADHDAALLDDAAEQFSQIGALAQAADAAAHAAGEHARAGSRIKELESATRAHWLASQCRLHTPATRLIEAPLPITDREREIAHLVADGLTNREIADRLGVSVRTIDGHLYRIFAKLRIEDRDQLARLVALRRVR